MLDGSHAHWFFSLLCGGSGGRSSAQIVTMCPCVTSSFLLPPWVSGRGLGEAGLSLKGLVAMGNSGSCFFCVSRER